MGTRGRSGTVLILVAVAVLMLCSLAPMANSETISNECEVEQCFSTQFTLYNLDRERTNYMYQIYDNWYDNITALELMKFVLESEGVPYNTTTGAAGTVFTSVNGTASNESWDWAFYLDRDGMWEVPSDTIDNALIKNIDNYAVALVPYAGGEHNPFQQSVGDWLDENAVEPYDEYIHSSGKVSSDDELLGTNLTDVQLKVGGGEGDYVLMASMIISNGSENVTDVAGHWWEMIWNNADRDGQYSEGDAWVVRTNNPHGSDYHASFESIESYDDRCNTDSDCLDGQICSDGTCADEPDDSHPTNVSDCDWDWMPTVGDVMPSDIGVYVCDEETRLWNALEQLDENPALIGSIACDEEPTEDQLNESNLADLLNEHGEILVVKGNDTFYMAAGPTVSLLELRDEFAFERPDDVLLVYDKEDDKFQGSFYLYDFHRADGDQGVRVSFMTMIEDNGQGVNRAELMKIIVEGFSIINLIEEKKPDAEFDDVEEGEWYDGFILEIVISSGEEIDFSPGEVASRAQIMMWRFTEYNSSNDSAYSVWFERTPIFGNSSAHSIVSNSVKVILVRGHAEKSSFEVEANVVGEVGESFVLIIVNETDIADSGPEYAWGLVTTKRPSAILLRDEKNRFAGYLSPQDFRELQLPAGRARHTWAFLMETDENGTVTNANIIEYEACPMPETTEESGEKDGPVIWSEDGSEILVHVGGVDVTKRDAAIVVGGVGVGLIGGGMFTRTITIRAIRRMRSMGGSDHYLKPGVERQTAMSTAADTALDDYVED